MQNYNAKLKNLRKRYPKFIYEGYSCKICGDNLEIFFDFKIEPDIQFKPKIIIENVNKKQIAKIKDGGLNNLIFNLGLIEMISYWKATCSPEIIIKAGYLNKEQINWWKDLIIKGMGQFFYENKINFTKQNFLKIEIDSECNKYTSVNSLHAELPLPSSHLWERGGRRGRSPLRPMEAKKFSSPMRDKYLVPMGGGKDSAITLELLKKSKISIRCFGLNPTDAALKIIKMASINSPQVIVRRKIDKKLLELNQKGFLNGHTPFSAYLAFLSFLVAAIFGQKYIVLSNERSSNEGNLKYRDKIVNHQWSKSFEFEQKFRKYSKKYLFSGIEYFSFLRPLYEIQIAKLFSKYPKYFSAFLSCNEAYKTSSGTKKPTRKWCGNCSKCLFVFAALYSFTRTAAKGEEEDLSSSPTDEKNLIKIFRKNLFNDKKLLPIMQQLIGERGFKPFECVGTKKESLAAFYLSWKKNRGATTVKLPFLLDYFQKKILPKYLNSEKELKKILNGWNNRHNLPENLKKILQKEISKKN